MSPLSLGLVMLPCLGEEEGSGGEVSHVDEPVGDSLEDSDVVVGAFDPPVGRRVGVVEGEDLVAPFEEGLGELVELEERMVVVDLDEGAEGLVGLVGVLSEVDAVEVLQPSARPASNSGRPERNPAESFDPVGFEPDGRPCWFDAKTGTEIARVAPT